MKSLINKVKASKIPVPLLLFGISFYAFSNAILNYSTTPKWVVLSIVLIPLFFLRKNNFNLNRVFLFLIISLIGIVCINSLRSHNPWDSIKYVIPLIISLLVFQQVADFEKGENTLKKVGTILIFILTPLVLYSLSLILIDYTNNVYSHDSTYDYRFTFGHRNQFSHLLCLAIPFLASLWSKVKRKNGAIVILIALYYSLVLLLQNRTSYLIILGLYPVLFLAYKIKQLSSIKWKVALVATLTLLITTAYFILKNTRFSNTLSYLFESSYGSGNERLRIWKNSIEVWKQNPLIGKGSGDWKIEILNTPLRFTQAEESAVFYQRAHNEFFHLLVEQGMIGVLLFVCIGSFLIYRFIKSYSSFQLPFIILSLILSFGIITSLSFPLERVELLLLFFTAITPLIIQTKSGSSYFSNKITKTIVKTTVASGILIYSTLLFYNESLFKKYQESGEVKHLEEIEDNFYTIDPTSTPIAWYQGNFYYARQKYEKALSFYLRAEQYNPYHVHVLNNIGSCYYLMGSIEQAKEYYNRSLDVNPLFSDALINLAALQFNQGDIDPALLTILKVNPDWEPSHYKSILLPILKAKCHWLIELHDDPPFERFLKDVVNNDSLLYHISRLCRKSSRSYENELRKYCADEY